jgi:hypothetical protein
MITLLGSSTEILDGYLKPWNKKYRGFKEALILFENRNFKTLLEIGTSSSYSTETKNEAKSTLIFGSWANMFNATLYSVDLSKEVLLESKSKLNAIYKSVEFIQEDGRDFLENFPLLIDFLYLDAGDFATEDQKELQALHLEMVKRALPQMHQKSVIMIDDCGYKNGGKGRYVIEFLTRRGWKIKLHSFQVILTQD